MHACGGTPRSRIISPTIHLSLSPPYSTFRTYRTGKQYHRRLTAGWRTFVETRSLSVGDVIHFWRDPRDDTGPAEALTMRIKVVCASRVMGGDGGGGG